MKVPATARATAYVSRPAYTANDRVGVMLIVQSPSQLSRYAIAHSLLGTHRWTGCKCKVKKTFFGKGRYACEDANCPCVLADRECDPELCKGCKCKKFVAGFPSYSSTFTNMGFT